MKPAELFFSYAVWHYSRGLQDFLNVWSNFLWFLYNFFSVSLLVRTLFSPWRRMDELGRSGFHLKAFLEKFVTNLIVRGIGICARFFVIVSGCLTILTGFILGFIFFVAWCLLPVVIVGLIVFGFRSIILP